MKQGMGRGSDFQKIISTSLQLPYETQTSPGPVFSREPLAQKRINNTKAGSYFRSQHRQGEEENPHRDHHLTKPGFIRRGGFWGGLIGLIGFRA